MNKMGLFFRFEVRETDRHSISRITGSSGCFSEKEVSVALELAEERLAKGERSGYLFIFAESLGEVIGYICFGPDAGAEQSYHIYWIAVENSSRHSGIGGELLKKAEEEIKRAGGRHIYIETSSKDIYIPARSFYEKSGYIKAAFLQDFYAEGDSKIIYSKEIC